MNGFSVYQGIELDSTPHGRCIAVGNRDFPVLSSIFGALNIRKDEDVEYLDSFDLSHESYDRGQGDGITIDDDDREFSVCLLITVQPMASNVKYKALKEGAKDIREIEVALRCPTELEYYAKHMEIGRSRVRFHNITGESLDFGKDDEAAKLHEQKRGKETFDIRKSGGFVLSPRHCTKIPESKGPSEFLLLITRKGAVELKIDRPRIEGERFLSNVLVASVDEIEVNGERELAFNVYNPKELVTPEDL
jgi:hypothetical protein